MAITVKSLVVGIGVALILYANSIILATMALSPNLNQSVLYAFLADGIIFALIGAGLLFWQAKINGR